jgi:alpha-tubulin suppressor-like RCC1 family protein
MPGEKYGNMTYTLESGSTNENMCGTFVTSECESSPRKYGVYPVYVAGSNSHGQSITDSVLVGADGIKYVRANMATCDLLGGAEVYRVAAGGRHSLMQTVRVTGLKAYSANTSASRIDSNHTGVLRVDYAIWAFGSNLYGQLGAEAGRGLPLPSTAPSLVPRAVFPAALDGNLISAALQNNRFRYYFWNDVTKSRDTFEVTLADGHYTPAGMATELSTQAHNAHGHPANMILARYDVVTQRVVLGLGAVGVQLDFSLPGGIPPRFFGFTVNDTVPSTGVLNEVSEAAGNDRFTYRVWCIEYPKCNDYREVTVALPPGIYTLSRLNQIVSETTLKNGDGINPIRFTMAMSTVIVNFNRPFFQVVFTAPRSIAPLLGFTQDVPAVGPVFNTGVYTTETRSLQLRVLTRQFPAQQWRGYLSGAGSGDFGSSFQPAEFVGEQNGLMAVSMYAGKDHSFVQAVDDTTGKARLFGFGLNKWGQLGTAYNAGTDDPNSVPIPIPKFDEYHGGLRAKKVVAGASHTLVLASDGTLWSFGSNQFGQLGVTEQSGTLIPVFEPVLINMTNITGDALFQVRPLFSLSPSCTCMLPPA